MKERRPPQSKQSKQPTPDKPVIHERGALARFLGMGSALVSAVLLAVAVSVVIECVGIALEWWPSDHAMMLLLAERSYIEAIDQYPMTALSPQGLTELASTEFDGAWRSIISPGSGSKY